MERLTIDTKILFCDISQCRETPGGSFCEDGYCDQRRCYERLREYERLGDIAELTALVKVRDDGRVVVLPCKQYTTVYYLSDKQVFVGRYLAQVGQTTHLILQDRETLGICWVTDGVWFLTRAEAEAALKGENDESSKV